MKAYVAWSGPKQQVKAIAACPPVRVLISFAFDDKRGPKSTFAHERLADVIDLADADVVLDSGAFSVWTVGTQIDLGRYIDWARDRMERFGECCMINLDVIPGSPTQPATTRERDRAVSQSMENADAIRAAGLPVMEVFHLYEPYTILDQLLERRGPNEMLAIGGIAGQAARRRADIPRFADAIFTRVHDYCGGWEAITPLHGLGVSPDAPVGRRYPWWSIDSTSWNIFDRYGAEVRRDGRSQKPANLHTGVGRGRTSVRSVADLYYLRTLKRWRRIEKGLTTMWADRGVGFDIEVPSPHG